MQIFIWTGPDTSDYKFGDIIEILEDGVHPGKRVVSGDWNSDCIMRNVVIIDVPGITEAQVTSTWGQLLALPAQLLSVLRISMVGRIATQALPLLIRQRLSSRKRATTTLAQLRDLLSRREKCSDTELLSRVKAYLTNSAE